MVAPFVSGPQDNAGQGQSYRPTPDSGVRRDVRRQQYAHAVRASVDGSIRLDVAFARPIAECGVLDRGRAQLPREVGVQIEVVVEIEHAGATAVVGLLDSDRDPE